MEYAKSILFLSDSFDKTGSTSYTSEACISKRIDNVQCCSVKAYKEKKNILIFIIYKYY